MKVRASLALIEVKSCWVNPDSEVLGKRGILVPLNFGIRGKSNATSA